ncbi:MAG: ion transporter, partial [Magnetococcales bacterium]|nr:ion transporter [Magnetococcales bacterium]
MHENHVSHTSLQGESRFRVIWNYLVLLGISWYAVTVPIYIALDLDSQGWSFALDIVWTCFFVVDIFLNFRHPYLENGELITDKKDTARHYLRGWFSLDLLATIPFDLLLMLLHSNQPWVFHAMRMVRIVKVFRLFRITDVVVTLSSSGKKGLVTDVVLDAHSVADEISITDQEVETFYANNSQMFRANESRHLSHILVQSKEGVEESTAISKLTQARMKIANGKLSFAEAARHYSDDVTSKEGGSLGEVPRGMM